MTGTLPPDIWARLHGASTHFPIAMILGATAIDGLVVVAWGKPLGRSANAAATYCLSLGALGGLLAVVSGLYLTKGELWGDGALRWHHRFVWPAFGLMVAVAVWRLLVGERLGRRGFLVYVMVELILAGLTAAAGYWGAELLQGVP
jgi:uncharacterized membrane protein